MPVALPGNERVHTPAFDGPQIADGRIAMAALEHAQLVAYLELAALPAPREAQAEAAPPHDAPRVPVPAATSALSPPTSL
jgi:hypothetical protein